MQEQGQTLKQTQSHSLLLEQIQEQDLTLEQSHPLEQTQQEMTECACSSMRKATRLITQFYDQAIRSTGLRSTQCSVLITISQHPCISVGELATLMVMDQTTVTRTISILREQGLIDVHAEENDARRKSICLTDHGVKKLEEVVPLWQQVQQEFEHKVGLAPYRAFIAQLADIHERLT
jgi:DNA-binding MarR family transcriptional regulator